MPFLIAGAVIGLLGVLCFGLVHAVVIVPIWTRLPGGVPFAVVAGMAMGWALYEIRVAGWTFGALVWLTLLPMTLLGVTLRATGVHGADDTWEVVAECALAAAAGAVAGRLIGGRWRAALAMAAASLALTLAQAGPIPVMNSVRAGSLFIGLMVVYIACGGALGVVASLVSRRASSSGIRIE